MLKIATSEAIISASYLPFAELAAYFFLIVDEPLQLPIDGVLDLHTFQPRQVQDLVIDYLAACRDRGILQVRIIHGKGIGQLRQTVRTVLSRHPDVVSFADDHALFGGWGATIVQLRPAKQTPSPPE